MWPSYGRVGQSFTGPDRPFLQISEFEDSDGRRTFVPSLYGYARKVSTTRSSRQWDWEQYETELGWSEDQLQGARKFVGKLESIAREWQPEARFKQGWISLRCLGREMLGVQVFKKRGLELWIRISGYSNEGFPAGVNARQTKEYLYLGGNLDGLTDDQLHRICEAAMEQAGLLQSSKD